MRAVDLFAGAGGFSEGAKQAGCDVLLAANHWPLAVEYHKRNHPHTEHLCQDLNQADFTAFPDSDILLASPSCVGHTKARGKEGPSHDKERSTAWAVVTCCEAKKPPIAVIENVPCFLRWALYPAWEQALKLLGYALSVNVVQAQDVGLAQLRPRVFIIATKSRTPFKLTLPKMPAQNFSEVIEWQSEHWKSITHRKKPLVPATHRQIAHGRANHGARFLLPYFGYSRRRGESRTIHAPLGTLLTRVHYTHPAKIPTPRAKSIALSICPNSSLIDANLRLSLKLGSIDHTTRPSFSVSTHPPKTPHPKCTS